MPRARAWAKDEAKDKVDITRVAAKARKKVESEATERARAWAESKAKEKAEIARLAAEASEKAEAKEEARSTEKAYAANRAS